MSNGKFWSTEVRTVHDDQMVKVLEDMPSYQQAMRQARTFQSNEGRKNGLICLVIKCGGTPLQCAIDGTAAHYVW